MLRNDDVTSSRSLRSLPLNRAGGSEDEAGVRRREGGEGRRRGRTGKEGDGGDGQYKTRQIGSTRMENYYCIFTLNKVK